MAAADRTILIAGAGIGGLAAAIALAGRGFKITLIEQRPGLAEEGAGIQLGPNATRVLAALGVAPHLHGRAVTPGVLRLHSARTGGALATMPLGEHMVARHGAPYWVLHRAELQETLWSACRDEPRIDVRFGWCLATFTAADQGVAISSTTGERLEGAALIGADGLWSQVRAGLGDGGPPRASGKVAWRALVDPARLPVDLDIRDVGIWMGPEAHVVHYPVLGGRRLNLVVVVDDPLLSEDWNAPADAAELWPHLTAWPQRIRGLLHAADGWRRWTLWERPVAGRWSKGPVTLLGDAAHPVLPFLAQGAGLALEDAVVLRNCLAAMPDQLAAAFANYVQRRRWRVMRVQAASRQNGAMFHSRGVMGLARDLVLQAMPRERLLARLDWLYGFDAASA